MFSGRLFLNPFDFGPMMVGFLVIYDALGALVLCILISIVISWVSGMGGRIPRYNKGLELINTIANFATAPVRRILPLVRTGSVGLDFSPLIALVVISVLQHVVLSLGRAVAQ